MAITFSLREIGFPASPGQDGACVARLILDGSATTCAITLPSSHSIKTIKNVVGATIAAANAIGAGIAGTTGVTVTVAAGVSTNQLDVLILGGGT